MFIAHTIISLSFSDYCAWYFLKVFIVYPKGNNENKEIKKRIQPNSIDSWSSRNQSNSIDSWLSCYYYLCFPVASPTLTSFKLPIIYTNPKTIFPNMYSESIQPIIVIPLSPLSRLMHMQHLTPTNFSILHKI